MSLAMKMLACLIIMSMVLAHANAQAPPTSPASGTQGLSDMRLLQSSTPEPAGPPIPLGPYAVTLESAAGLPTHTVYRPTDLSAFPKKDTLPVVAWANGACRADGKAFKNYLTKIASHGFLVIAVGPMDVPAEGPGRITAGQLIEAIDWAERENKRKGSPLEGRTDSAHVAVMGQSCGGLLTIDAAHDPRIDTIGVWNSGVYVSGQGRSNTGTTKERLADLHTPTIYVNGWETDAATPNSDDDFARIQGVPVFYGSLHNGGHRATYAHRNGGEFAAIAANWLLWQLKGDRTAAKMFQGEDCTLCRDPRWRVQRKNFP